MTSHCYTDIPHAWPQASRRPPTLTNTLYTGAMLSVVVSWKLPPRVITLEPRCRCHAAAKRGHTATTYRSQHPQQPPATTPLEVRGTASQSPPLTV